MNKSKNTKPTATPTDTAPGGHRQPLAAVGDGVAKMFADERDVVQLVMFEDQFITPGDVIRRCQEPDLTVVRTCCSSGVGFLRFCSLPRSRLAPSVPVSYCLAR